MIAKVARLESDSVIDGTSGDFNTTAYSLSAEVGHRFDLAESVFLEPQAEMSWGYVDGKTFTTLNKTSGIATDTTVDSTTSSSAASAFVPASSARTTRARLMSARQSSTSLTAMFPSPAATAPTPRMLRHVVRIRHRRQLQPLEHDAVLCRPLPYEQRRTVRTLALKRWRSLGVLISKAARFISLPLQSEI